MNALRILDEDEFGYGEYFSESECFRASEVGIPYIPSPTSTSQSGTSYTWIDNLTEEEAFLGFAPRVQRLLTLHPAESSNLPSDLALMGSTSSCFIISTETPVLSNKDLLLDVKHFLGFTTTELASAMGVSRQTVYSWFHEDTDIRQVNLSRLKLLHGLAEQCRVYIGAPLPRQLKKAAISGSSLLSLLSVANVAPAEVASHFNALLARAQSETNITETLTEKSKALGFREMPEWMRIDSIRQLIGQTSSDE
jgi:hypothetical protein